jgi:hypothetical protein
MRERMHTTQFTAARALTVTKGGWQISGDIAFDETSNREAHAHAHIEEPKCKTGTDLELVEQTRAGGRGEEVMGGKVGWRRGELVPTWCVSCGMKNDGNFPFRRWWL